MADWSDETPVTNVELKQEPTPVDVGRDKGQIVVLVGPEAGRTYSVGDDALIGRTSAAKIRLTAGDVSRNHALIRKDSKGHFLISDLGSRNGIMVNGVLVKEQPLRFGDKIRIGTKTILMFAQYDGLEDQLIQSQKLEAIGQLAGGVAHDFNNLLGAVLTNISFLQGLAPEIPLGQEDVRACLGDIEAAAKRAADLTRQLLGFARRGKYEEKFQDISAIAEEVRRLLGRSFDPNVVFDCSIAPGLWVKGDSSQLHQVILNLCINARDAMPEGGTLSIRVREEEINEDSLHIIPFLMKGKHVLVEIGDTGVGMNEEVKNRLFEPFFTTKGLGKGTGLGLATAYGIVKNHGGHISVESTPGKGSRFTVYLPSQAHQEAEATIGVQKRIHSGLILLIDDEEVYRKSTARLIESLGYEVLSARDGVEGLSMFKENQSQLDLVLLDLIMPRMSGEEVFHEIRALARDVRVLFTSGYLELKNVNHLLEEGAVGFLPKPFDAQALGEALFRALSERSGGANDL